MKTGIARLCGLIAAYVLTSVAALAFDDIPIVKYDPSLTIVEGNQPLYRTVELSVTAPFNLTPGQKLVIQPVITLLNKPDGVPDNVALSYVTFAPATLEFTQPNQTLKTTITADFPLGIAAGGYAYRIETQGWAPGTQDPWAFLNATVNPARAADVPTIVLHTPIQGDVYTYQPLVGPLSIPFSFTASAPPVSPITTVDANRDDIALSFTRTDNPDGSISGAGSFTVTAPGIYTVRARATNQLGTSTDSAEFSVVVSAPPPVVSISQPTGPSYTMVTGTTLQLPYAFSAQSYYGGIETLTATLNGTPVTFTPAGMNTLNATGSGTFNITSPGNYTLVVMATDMNGAAQPATRTFSVAAATPVPTVTINEPANGTTITRIAGSPATAVPFTFTATANSGFVINAVTATLNGAPVSFTTAGLGTATTTGTATLSISAPGTYTLVATGTSSGVVANATSTFTVTETTPPAANCDVIWLPPINLNKVQQGGSVLPIKFKICCTEHRSCHHSRDCSDRDCDDRSRNDCDDRDRNRYCDDRDDDDHDRNGSYDCDNGQHYGWGRDSDDEIHGKCKGDRDPSIVIAIYEVKKNGCTSTPTLYPYDRSSPNPPTYTIQGDNMYHLNFPVPKGKHTFRVDVYRPSGTGAPQLLGTKEFTSK